MFVGRYQDFESVAAQDPPELRRILRDGDPAERAWAGWALALRIGRGAIPELEEAARTAPTPGVRSLLLVILAGHGERDLIETFAIDDPDDDVRAAACRYLAAITTKDDVAAIAFLAKRLSSDLAPPVRSEVLGLVRDGRLDLPSDLVESHVGDTDLGVRGIAADLLLIDARSVHGLPAVLMPRALHEPDDELRSTISRAWIARGGGADLLGAITLDSMVDDRRAQELLGQIAGSGARFGWSTLRPFVGRNPTTDRLVGKLLALPLEPDALSWLLEIAARPLDEMPASVDRESHERVSAIYGAARTAWERLAEGLPTMAPESLSPDDRVQVARLADSLANELDDERAMALEDGGIDLDALPESEQPIDYQQNMALLRSMRRIVAAALR